MTSALVLGTLCLGVRRRQKVYYGLCRQSFLALLWEPEFPGIQSHPFLASLPTGLQAPQLKERQQSRETHNSALRLESRQDIELVVL